MARQDDLTSQTGWADQLTVLQTIKDALDRFNADRDWSQFHTPKDLAMALNVEAAELLELFLWKRTDEELDIERLAQELSDVLITTLNLASRLQIDLAAATQDKIADNALKYPVAKAKGKALKYDALD